MLDKAPRATAIALSLFFLAAQAANADNNASSRDDHWPHQTLRSTEFGQVNGKEDDASHTLSWKGIPYAKPPVGDLRWRAPVDPDKWSGVRSTQQFANACSQYGRIYGPGANNRYDATIGTTLNQAVGNEDCLYLNIWRPANGKTDLPVIVFFHGGSNVSGYTADPVYDGATLARTTNSIVVTPNFRLGILGFMDLPALKAGADADTASGNFAILDSIRSLEFVQRNIANFGGDPSNVTIMGQSAGAINVYALLTSPKVTAAQSKLFHRAVPLSGGLSLAVDLPAGAIPTMSPETTYASQGRALVANLMLDDGSAANATEAQAKASQMTDAQTAAYLRSKTPSQLFTTLLTRLSLLGLSGSGPIPEGHTVALDPVKSITQGQYLKVPVLAGNTRDEGKLFPSFLPLVGGSGSARKVTDAQLFATQFAYNANAPAQITIDQWITPGYLPVDAPVTGFTARAETFNRIFFLASRDNILNALKSVQPSVWYYRFDWDKEPAPWNDIYGAAHLFDLPFVFGNFGPSLMGTILSTNANEAGRLDLSNAMMKTIGAFAKKGDPNNDALDAYWPTWPKGLIFNATNTAKKIEVQTITPAMP
ncbi:carboxylesterase/lipase family protein [Noviherbaspirillum galbum]|uniref:Carboxylic ester hydrolase n=1 Tax=Noviherbaspirillum galbum TaxID=2709383 RepID=A0A6B3SZD7_9BURK|nr:carboxylesterase family protein [Noviherbaspirillum galbum]NEX64622.1 carboxylesterase family protein [Noviherbaspirillum galbum]